MPMLARVRAVVALLVVLSAAGFAAAQEPGVVNADTLRAEWTVASTRAGQAQVSGYLYNRNIMDASDVWMRVDRLDDGGVVQSYRRRVVGDVLSGSRSFFEVPVPAADARYQVTVETVRWLSKECR